MRSTRLALSCITQTGSPPGRDETSSRVVVVGVPGLIRHPRERVRRPLHRRALRLRRDVRLGLVVAPVLAAAVVPRVRDERPLLQLRPFVDWLAAAVAAAAPPRHRRRHQSPHLEGLPRASPANLVQGAHPHRRESVRRLRVRRRGAADETVFPSPREPRTPHRRLPSKRRHVPDDNEASPRARQHDVHAARVRQEADVAVHVRARAREHDHLLLASLEPVDGAHLEGLE
ncbi:uncharacterized protein MICPUCDRAFT_68293 [Micromonas pusilla CCMP1545]|uniref:Predicted protein n=1 Tax=Micromonas pusilla (strain CCMP1545) TaxID=564608 RepID=C1MRU7_MICPC|nr:uncharacterized protein MICPUCDRAFT_68293 [Micromonas pusilla CCMP1545]EEH57027.1 predicted protein [Micromonas pusilla CCMP1545]|mmetsp:Transcript_5101/g.18218  ORF Transcript_5101/g.18218 Transcript_5101/m.18218 type:complete len:230 (+) Transcript_5101:594-1283(+)|eukprot:XP_003058572.1 predicted protein [Micromonas pusilla CCMP1545]